MTDGKREDRIVGTILLEISTENLPNLIQNNKKANKMAEDIINIAHSK